MPARTIAGTRTIHSGARTIHTGARTISGARTVVAPPYDITPPEYSTGGTVDEYTMGIIFSENVVATNYLAGVTIKKNGVTQTIWYAARQSNARLVFYVLANPVTSHDTITWEYTVISGNITDIAGNPLLTVYAQTLTNNIVETGLHYVDPDATGANDGSSWTNAWTSFAALGSWSSVAVGDTVYLSGGSVSKTYNETLTVGKSGTSGHPITIDVGANSPSPTGHDGIVIIDGGGVREQQIHASAKHYVTINGLSGSSMKLRLQNPAGGESGMILIEDNTCDHIYLYYLDIDNSTNRGIYCTYSTNCIIHGCDVETGLVTNNYQTDGIYLSYNTNLIVENNICILGNSGTNHDDCLQIYNEDTITIRNNWLQCTDGRGNANCQALMYEETHGTVLVYNNVILGCSEGSCFILKDITDGAVYIFNNDIITQGSGGSSKAILLYMVSDSAKIGSIKNNIMCAPDGGWLIYSNYTLDLTGKLNNNCLYTTGAYVSHILSSSSYTWAQHQAAGYDASGINADPKFTTNYSDLHLQTSSPCKNAGADLSAYFTTDLEHITRPTGAWDMGAYEYH